MSALVYVYTLIIYLPGYSDKALWLDIAVYIYKLQCKPK